MPIDWFTVVAQALNFLVLVWLMKRFLYQPVLDAIAAREKGIREERADAPAFLKAGDHKMNGGWRHWLAGDCSSAETTGGKS